MQSIVSFLALFTLGIAVASSEKAMVAELGLCWDKSFRHLGKATPDINGNVFHDPYYKKKVTNDYKCHQIKRQIASEYGKDTSCLFDIKVKRYICKSHK